MIGIPVNGVSRKNTSNKSAGMADPADPGWRHSWD